MTIAATMTVQIAGGSITLRELTVGQIRLWMKRVETVLSESDMLDALLFEDFSLSDLREMIAEQSEPDLLEKATPSEIREKLLPAAREINRDFFSMRDRLAIVANRVAQRIEDGAGKTSNGTSPA